MKRLPIFMSVFSVNFGTKAMWFKFVLFFVLRMRSRQIVPETLIREEQTKTVKSQFMDRTKHMEILLVSTKSAGIKKKILENGGKNRIYEGGDVVGNFGY